MKGFFHPIRGSNSVTLSGRIGLTSDREFFDCLTDWHLSPHSIDELRQHFRKVLLVIDPHPMGLVSLEEVSETLSHLRNLPEIGDVEAIALLLENDSDELRKQSEEHGFELFRETLLGSLLILRLPTSE